jgi:RNA polymerase sigma-70 factor (ECF subfamily)
VPEQSVDDATLLARMQDGDDAAFATLVRRHTTRFYRVAYRFMNHPTEAEDVVQDAFIKLWEKPDSWRTDGGSAFTTWFYRVVVNLCLDRKKNKQTLPLSEDLPVPDLRPTQEENMIERQQEKQLETHIALLPERQRTALNLCFYEGLSNQEAATIMGVRLKALQSLLMRAKMTLKLKLIDAKGA